MFSPSCYFSTYPSFTFFLLPILFLSAVPLFVFVIFFFFFFTVQRMCAGLCRLVYARTKRNNEFSTTACPASDSFDIGFCVERKWMVMGTGTDPFVRVHSIFISFDTFRVCSFLFFGRHLFQFQFHFFYSLLCIELIYFLFCACEKWNMRAINSPQPNRRTKTHGTSAGSALWENKTTGSQALPKIEINRS